LGEREGRDRDLYVAHGEVIKHSGGQQVDGDRQQPGVFFARRSIPKAVMETVSTLSVTGEQLTDEELVNRVKAGDTALYEIIMRRYNQRLYRVARAILRDDGEAEDVMQLMFAPLRSSTSSRGSPHSPPGSPVSR
jgi:hypothetical protein